MFASLLTLSRSDLKALKITDEYSIHRIVYDFFEDIRTEEDKKASVPSRVLYVDKGGDFNKREILILSDRLPKRGVSQRQDQYYPDKKSSPRKWGCFYILFVYRSSLLLILRN